jgi:hypothetical protein
MLTRLLIISAARPYVRSHPSTARQLESTCDPEMFRSSGRSPASRAGGYDGRGPTSQLDGEQGKNGALIGHGEDTVDRTRGGSILGAAARPQRRSTALSRRQLRSTASRYRRSSAKLLPAACGPFVDTTSLNCAQRFPTAPYRPGQSLFPANRVSRRWPIGTYNWEQASY